MIIHRNTIIALILALNFAPVFAQASAPESAYLFAYADTEIRGRNGLHFAWSLDQQHWQGIGPGHFFMYCDYGTWSGEKRMYDPFLFRGGRWLVALRLECIRSRWDRCSCQVAEPGGLASAILSDRQSRRELFDA